MSTENRTVRLHHVGIIVPTRDRADGLIELLGLPRHHEQFVPEYEADCIFVGDPRAYLEFIVPAGGKLREFNRGLGGLHHIALEVPDLAALARELQARGIRLLEPLGVAAGALRINFLSPAYTRGITVEFVESVHPPVSAQAALIDASTEKSDAPATPMKLAQALAVIRRMPPCQEGDYAVYLACGFMPMHLQTFLTAHLGLLRKNRPVAIRTGLYGDLAGNLEKAAKDNCGAILAVLEWSDLDPRLGYRHASGWRREQIPDILETATRRMEQLRTALVQLAKDKLVTMALPSLPLPPVFLSPPMRGDAAAFRLQSQLMQFATALAAEPMIRVLNPTTLDRHSPPGERLDLSSELRSGFPYSLSHASELGRLLAELLLLPSPKKGIITDLDNTLWSGILGEDGLEGVSWDLDRKSYGHALYQGILASLADSGALIGVASKNDPKFVEQALRRQDLLIPADSLFPVEASWGAKSEAVRRILHAWNIGPESVVFLDDSPLETAEVSAAFPEMDCRVFPASDERSIGTLLEDLRKLFGKFAVTEEDRLRVGSLRAADGFASAAASATPDDFLAQLDAEITLQIDRPDQRTFELINKTNQFNLNGKRLTETAWKTRCQDSSHFLISAAYRDKFGSLGTIGAMCGFRRGGELSVDVWVLSCRAFSRRIEHHILRELFEAFGVDSIELDYLPTDRNGPLSEFLAQVAAENPHPALRITKNVFTKNCPELHAKVNRL